MYSYTQVYNGIASYLENDIISKIDGWQKWVIGAGMSMALSKGNNVFEKIKEMPVVKTLEIIDDKDMINVDELYKYFKEQAEKSSITINNAITGPITFNKKDIDRLYEFIKGAK
jgi:hypothetical protein